MVQEKIPSPVFNINCISFGILIFAFNVALFLSHTGITFPSGEVQKRLLQSVYQEANVDPTEVSYVEAHGTGTKAGDPQELNSIVDVFCTGRQGPLMVGSTKSNMGHPEPASGKLKKYVLHLNF